MHFYADVNDVEQKELRKEGRRRENLHRKSGDEHKNCRNDTSFRNKSACVQDVLVVKNNLPPPKVSEKDVRSLGCSLSTAP